MRYENSDRGKIYLSMMKTMFKGTPYGSSVIGEVEDLKTVSREKVKEYFKTYYSPNNAVIVIVGDVNAEQVINEIERKYGEIPSQTKLEKIKKDHLNKLGFGFKIKLPSSVALKGSSPTPLIMKSYQAVKIGVREGFVLDILSSILGDGDSSYLNQKLVLNSQPQMLSVYAANFTLMESGVFFVGGKLLEGTDLKKFQNSLETIINNSCDSALSERALEKVKNQYLYQMVSQLDTNAGLAQFLGDREVHYGDYNFYKKEMEIYNSISLKELKDVCHKYLYKKPNLDMSIWNKN